MSMISWLDPSRSASLREHGGWSPRRATFLREMGIDLKNADTKLQLATRPLPVPPRTLPSHPSDGPLLWVTLILLPLPVFHWRFTLAFCLFLTAFSKYLRPYESHA